MRLTIKSLLFCAALVAFMAGAASAYPIHRQEKCVKAAVAAEESYASLSFLAGVGTANDRFGSGGVAKFSAVLDYPVVDRLSLSARFDHSETRWDDQWYSRCFPTIDNHSDETLFTLGVKVELR